MIADSHLVCYNHPAHGEPCPCVPWSSRTATCWEGRCHQLRRYDTINPVEPFVPSLWHRPVYSKNSPIGGGRLIPTESVTVVRNNKCWRENLELNECKRREWLKNNKLTGTLSPAVFRSSVSSLSYRRTRVTFTVSSICCYIICIRTEQKNGVFQPDGLRTHIKPRCGEQNLCGLTFQGIGIVAVAWNKHIILLMFFNFFLDVAYTFIILHFSASLLLWCINHVLGRFSLNKQGLLVKIEPVLFIQHLLCHKKKHIDIPKRAHSSTARSRIHFNSCCSSGD